MTDDLAIGEAELKLIDDSAKKIINDFSNKIKNIHQDIDVELKDNTEDKEYIDVITFFSTQPAKFLTSLLMIVAFFFSALSISEIFEDYVHDEKIKNIFIRFN